MNAGKRVRHKLALGAMALTLVGVALPPEARGAFVVVDGLDRKKMSRLGVSVALVRVTGVRLDRARKRKGYLLHRWLKLTVVKRLFGPAVPASGLRDVPYSPMVDSAWPPVKGTLQGRHFLMAWVKGSPCGLGLTVAVGPRVTFPMTAKGPGDPRVAAVKRLLDVVRLADDSKRLMALRRIFHKKSGYLARLADLALVRLDSKHKGSLTRYLHLLRLVRASRNGDPQLGWPILNTLSKFPPIRTAAAYRRWKRQSLPGQKLTFSAFRKLVQHRLSAIAGDRHAEVNLRRLALLALVAPPSFLGTRGDPMDPHAIRPVRPCLRDRHVEVRRSAVRALLTVARKTRYLAPKRARRLVAEVRATRRREKSTAERYLLTRMIRKLWSRRRRPSRRRARPSKK